MFRSLENYTSAAQKSKEIYSSRDQLKFYEADNDRIFFQQYKIAKIKATGPDALPNSWKILSPVGQRRAKLKLENAMQRYQEMVDEQWSQP